MKQRVITGVITAAAFLALTIAGSYWFGLLILALAAIGYAEFIRMNEIPYRSLTAWIGFAGVFVFVFPWESWTESISPSFERIAWTLLFAFLAVTVITKNRTTVDRAAIAFLGAIYVGVGFQYMVETRLEHGLYWTLFIFICIWVTDIGAYFSGWAFGKHLLWPSISPKKTIEGAVGGSLIAIAVALLFAWYSPERLDFGQAMILGLAISLAGQFGDLIESAYKRVRGTKDSGGLFPGHGGVLDRCDSWLIVFPLLYIFELLP